MTLADLAHTSTWLGLTLFAALLLAAVKRATDYVLDRLHPLPPKPLTIDESLARKAEAFRRAQLDLASHLPVNPYRTADPQGWAGYQARCHLQRTYRAQQGEK